ncbi:MAG: cytochrome B6, partial [Proteobacteria bacterium]|nr:cytochrome B6 [Pseudomonadota bacterium]
INIGGNLYQKFGVFYNYIAERGDIKKSDYGRMNKTERLMDAFVFKVPSLRNVAVTAPYLHDGSAETIEEAIEIMGQTQLGRSLTTDEILLIKAFLKTLTGKYKNIMLDAPS